MSSGANTYDVAVVGAGPAGLAAAATTAGAGLTTLLLDENPTPGGQIYRAVTTTPLQERSILGDDFWAGAPLVAEAKASGAEIVAGATVWSLDATRELAASWAGASRFIKARRVILATGALERPFPIPGWTLPGVMTAGALQTLLKACALVPDGRLLLAGCGPLRSEEHTSELQSPCNLVCRLLLENKKRKKITLYSQKKKKKKKIKI